MIGFKSQVAKTTPFDETGTTFPSGTIESQTAIVEAMDRLKGKAVDLTNLTMGYVLTWNNTNNRFELQAVGALSNSIVQVATFGKQGSVSSGSYLRIGEISSQTGWAYRGAAKIVAIYAETISNVSSNSTFQVVERTAVGTYADISGATCVISSGGYYGSNDPLAINLTSGRSLLVKLSSGSGVSSANVTVFMVPQ